MVSHPASTYRDIVLMKPELPDSQEDQRQVRCCFAVRRPQGRKGPARLDAQPQSALCCDAMQCFTTPPSFTNKTN